MDVMQNDLPFGGKMVVLTGDWRQTLPVARGRALTTEATHLMSDLWPMCNMHELTTNMRIERLRLSDPAAADRLAAHEAWLLAIGEGTMGEPIVDADGLTVDDTRRVVLPEDITFRGKGLQAYLDYMYPGFDEQAAAILEQSELPVHENQWARCASRRHRLHVHKQCVHTYSICPCTPIQHYNT